MHSPWSDLLLAPLNEVGEEDDGWRDERWFVEEQKRNAARPVKDRGCSLVEWDVGRCKERGGHRARRRVASRSAEDRIRSGQSRKRDGERCVPAIRTSSTVPNFEKTSSRSFFVV